MLVSPLIPGQLPYSSGFFLHFLVDVFCGPGQLLLCFPGLGLPFSMGWLGPGPEWRRGSGRSCTGHTPGSEDASKAGGDSEPIAARGRPRPRNPHLGRTGSPGAQRPGPLALAVGPFCPWWLVLRHAGVLLRGAKFYFGRLEKRSTCMKGVVGDSLELEPAGRGSDPGSHTHWPCVTLPASVPSCVT